jgi:DNA-binding MarR family transcriptional regulator
MSRAERAELAWVAMRSLVLDSNDRRRDVAEALGMSYIRVKALRRVAAGPTTIRDLAESLGTDAPYATIVVDDLEQRGLVERSVDARDRRRRIVTATAAGTAEAERAGQIMDAPPPALVELPAADLAALERIVTGLLPPSAVPRPASDPGRPPGAPSTSPPRGAARSGTARSRAR